MKILIRRVLLGGIRSQRPLCAVAGGHYGEKKPFFPGTVGSILNVQRFCRTGNRSACIGFDNPLRFSAFTAVSIDP